MDNIGIGNTQEIGLVWAGCVPNWKVTIYQLDGIQIAYAPSAGQAWDMKHPDRAVAIRWNKRMAARYGMDVEIERQLRKVFIV